MTNQRFVYFLEEDSPFSNFHRAIFTDASGQRYESSEKYFFMQKALFFNDLEAHAEMKNQQDPAIIKQIGAGVKNFDLKRWIGVSQKFMLEAIRLKVTQNDYIKKMLIETGDAIIAEASPDDEVWGIGLSEADAIAGGNVWKGQNLLGKCFMQLRQELSQ